MKIKFAIILLVLINITSVGLSKVTTGTNVIELMKEKYNNGYEQNFTFLQHIVQYNGDSIIHKTIWHEAYSSTSQLVIKFNNDNSGNGFTFQKDTMYGIQDNHIENMQRDIRDLLVLVFDIYSQPVRVSLDKLSEKGYDLNKVYETSLDGKAVYCVGAENEDDNSNRFYIDKEHLLFVRMVNHNHSSYNEALFENCITAKEKYIATNIILLNDGKQIMTEEYFDIDFPKQINPYIFNSENFKTIRWNSMPIIQVL